MSDNIDIRETMEARKEKAAVMIHEHSDGMDGHECTVCGERFPLGSDEIVGSLGVGDYHIEHLNKGEIEYVRERAAEDERQLDSAAFAEEVEKSNTEIYGDAATRGAF